MKLLISRINMNSYLSKSEVNSETFSEKVTHDTQIKFSLIMCWKMYEIVSKEINIT